MRATRQVLVGVVICACLAVAVMLLGSIRYAAGRLGALARQPAYASAEDGMRATMLREFPGGRVQIIGAGNDLPGLQYVGARAWPASSDARSRGENGGRVERGSYFLRMDHGWVLAGEGELGGPFLALGKILIEGWPRNGKARRQ